MPGTWNGIGTRYYGSKDQHADSTFVTTEWFVIFHFPILPLRSMRVEYGGTAHGLQRTTSKYRVVQNQKLNWQQVISTYFLAIGTLLIAYLSGYIVANIFANSDWSVLATIIGFFVPIWIAQKLFFDAKPTSSPSIPIRQQSSVNLANVTRPNISAPSLLDEPFVHELDPLVGVYAELRVQGLIQRLA